MSNLAEEFATLDKENHVRMRGAIKTAIRADFKVEDSPKHDSNVGFSKKSIEFFVREKIDPASFPKSTVRSSENTPTAREADNSSHCVSSGPAQASEPTAAPQSEENSDLEDLAQVLAEEETESAQEAELNQDATEQPVNPQVTSDDQQSELYDEGFAAGRAAALSELEEQRLEHLAVLKSISEKLLTDSVFDFDNISKKVLDTVNELSSERCGLAIDENPEGFLKRITAQIDQVRNLSQERSVFFNEEDLTALKSFAEFENYFAMATVRSDPVLKRGDVVVKVGGVELRDAPFADYAKGIQDE